MNTTKQTVTRVERIEDAFGEFALIATAGLILVCGYLAVIEIPIF